jgi:hypothetical protein
MEDNGIMLHEDIARGIIEAALKTHTGLGFRTCVKVCEKL